MVYDIVNELTGDTYKEVVAFAAQIGCVATLVTRRPESVNDACRRICSDLRPFLRVEAEVTEWPGTILHGGTAILRRYELTREAINVLSSSVRGLYEWRHPSRPEDLSFIKNGSPWLVSIAHENDAYFELEPDEYNALIVGVPGIVDSLAEPK